MKEIVRCPHCDAKMVEYRHTINKNMVKCLFVILEAGGIMPFKEFNNKVTYNQRNNFQKLQYWGLVKKVKDKLSDERRAGVWALTDKCLDFLQGILEINKNVFTYRNKTMRFEGEFISIEDLEYEPYRQKLDYNSDQVPRYVTDDGQFEFFR